MLALVLLTTLVIAGAIAATSGMKSRAEAVIAASLVFNALIIAPLYLLGLAGHLDRVTLGVGAGVPSAALIAYRLRGHPRKNLGALILRFLQLAFLPLEGIRRTWQARSLLLVGASAATLLFPYMLIIAYLAPTWRDWDTLWYHEPISGFTIQNHGFAVVPLPPVLQGVNGVHRLCEMTQTWFAIYGGRRVIDETNVFFMPLLAASMFALARRYTKDVVVSIGVASALVLMPGFLRLVQTTMVDPQSAALLLAAAYWATQVKLDRDATGYAIVGLTLAAGAKIWSIVPVTMLSLYLLVRIVRRWRQLGGRFTLLAVFGGSAAVLGMQAVTYYRNLVNFKNPLWPVVNFDNARLNIHWKGALNLDLTASHGGINFNDPFDVFYRKMTSLPFSVMGPGHTWQVNDYGFAFAWVVLPLAALATIMIGLRWLFDLFARRRGQADETVAGAMMLALTAMVSLFSSPAIFIARYHVPSVGMLLACLCWMAGSGRGRRIAADAMLFAQIGSLLLAYWVPKRMILLYLYDAAEIIHWVKTPYPARELKDLPGGQMISPIVATTGMAREKEIKAGSVVAFDSMDYPALLWNNDFSNKVVWLGETADPLGEARRIDAAWVYTRPGTTLSSQLAGSADWQLVGGLEAEGPGSVYRRKR